MFPPLSFTMCLIQFFAIVFQHSSMFCRCWSHVRLQSSTIVSTFNHCSLHGINFPIRPSLGPEPADVPTSSSRASVRRREAAPLSEPPATELVVFGAFCMASMAFRSTQNEGKWWNMSRWNVGFFTCLVSTVLYLDMFGRTTLNMASSKSSSCRDDHPALSASSDLLEETWWSSWMDDISLIHWWSSFSGEYAMKKESIESQCHLNPPLVI